MDPQTQLPDKDPRFADYDMTTLVSEWETSKQYTKNYTNDFQQLDQIVDGIPVTQEDGAPYVGDTTLAGLVRSIPRASIQQLPIFAAMVNGTKNSIDAVVGSWILRRGVFNEDTFGKGLLSTLQIGGEQALTHGYAPFMCATGTMMQEFGTTMRLMHYADASPEPGIQDHNETGFDYVEANLVKSRVQKIRDKAAANPNTTWNVPALDRLLAMEPEVNKYSMYQSSARQGQGQAAPTYTFVTKYEVGSPGKFCTFCPQIEDEPLREVKNKSKFGYPRVQYLVIDPAPLTPFGISRVRLASPNQNLMNAYYQNVASLLIYNSDPALLKRGRFTKPVQLKRRQVWETLDQNATVELKTMAMDSLQTFVQTGKQMSAQVQNIMGAPAGNVAGGENTMGYSKTAPGVKAQREDQDLSTNQITNIMENFLRQYALVALDTYVSEQTDDEVDVENPSIDTVVLDDEAKNAINRILEDQNSRLEEGQMAATLIGDDNEWDIDWNAYYDRVKVWNVEIELSLGKDELEEKTRKDLQDMLVVMEQNADPNDVEKQQRIRDIQDKLLEKTVPDSKRLPTTPPPAAPPTTETPVGDTSQVTMNS